MNAATKTIVKTQASQDQNWQAFKDWLIDRAREERFEVMSLAKLLDAEDTDALLSAMNGCPNMAKSVHRLAAIAMTELCLRALD